MIFSGAPETLAMFAKLYKYLEEISANTHQQIMDARNVRDKVVQLHEEVTLMNTSMHASKKVTVGPSPFQVINLLVTCIGIVIIGFFAYNSYQLSRSSNAVTEGFAKSSQVLNATLTGINGLTVKHGHTESEVSRLDSLVQQQAQSIQELKKLNETAVRTFIRIRNDLDRKNKENAGSAAFKTP